MAFKVKTDFVGLSAKLPALKIKSSSDGRSASIAEATNIDGDIVAAEVYGETVSPTCEYELIAAMGENAEIELGAVNTVGEEKIILSGLEIATAAGAAPTFSANGADVGTAPVDGLKTYKVSIAGLTLKHSAQILFGAFELSGDGCHPTSANYSLSGEITTATVEGKVVSVDISSGRIECSVSVVATGAAEPQLTPGEGWKVHSPLACSNPDGDYPTYSATLVKYLTKAA